MNETLKAYIERLPENARAYALEAANPEGHNQYTDQFDPATGLTESEKTAIRGAVQELKAFDQTN